MKLNELYENANYTDDYGMMFNCDIMDLLKNIENESIDLIVTDPPYKVTSRGCSGTMGGYWKTDIAKSGKIFKNNSISCKDYLEDFYRVLKDKSILYIMCNNTNLQEMINEGTRVGFNFVKCLIWEKGNKICGTGTIDKEGVVGEIGGIKYKLQGAKRRKCDMFLVPKENYDEAYKIIKDKNYKIKLYKVETFNDALKILNNFL